MNILVTGCAGFIGFNLCLNLLKKKNINVFGIDNLNDYYDIKLKNNRLKILKKVNNFSFKKVDITNINKLNNYFKKNQIKYVVNLAAQAGVRYSITNPRKYLDSNIIGFFNILECSKKYQIKHLVYASTSSVYGDNNNFPLEESYNTDKPISFYAATKKSNEIMAYSYSYIYNLRTTGLRFFTVYGPYGRPDMSLFKFTKAIINSKPINFFNKGDHERDFTYIDDVVNAISKSLFVKKVNKIPFEIFNVGSDNPIHLKNFLKIIEKFLKKKAKVNMKKFQLGDIKKTHASIKKISQITGFRVKTSVSTGIEKFIEWYNAYYENKK